MKLLISLVSFMVLISSCQRQKVQTIPIDSEVMKYFNYQEGSYWVYQDSASGSHDTLIVTLNRLLGDPDKSGETYTEYVDITCQLRHAPDPFDTLKFNLRGNRIMLEFERTFVPGISTFPLTVYPYQVPNIAPLPGGQVEWIKIIPDYDNNGILYREIVEVHATADYPNVKYDDWIYFNKEVGIVKMRLSYPNAGINKTYNLIFSSVEKG